MDPILTASIVNGLFQLFQLGVERSTIITKLDGMPPEKYPDILDAMYAESKGARDAAIGKAPA